MPHHTVQDLEEEDHLDHELLNEVLSERPFRRRTQSRWGKRTGATLKYCSRCRGAAALREGFVLDSGPDLLMFSLKKRARWRILDHVKAKEEEEGAHKGERRRANSRDRVCVRGYVDYETPAPYFRRQGPWKRQRTWPAFLMKPGYHRQRSTLTHTQLEQLLALCRQGPENPMVKKCKEARKRRNRTAKGNKDESEEREEEEEEVQFAVYVVSDPHAVEEDYRDAVLDHGGGYLIDVIQGQDRWNKGPYFNPNSKRKELPMVTVVTNNTAKKGRWCCCKPLVLNARSPPPTAAMALLPEMSHNQDAYWCRYYNGAFDAERIQQKRLCARRKKMSRHWFCNYKDILSAGLV